VVQNEERRTKKLRRELTSALRVTAFFSPGITLQTILLPRAGRAVLNAAARGRTRGVSRGTDEFGSFVERRFERRIRSLI